MIVEQDFYDNIDVTYDRDYNCEEYGCVGKCYCSKITNSKITSIDISSIVEKIYRIYFDNSNETRRDNKINSIFGITKAIDIYTIERIIIYNNLWEFKNWNISIKERYYGEEIDAIFLNIDVAIKIEDQLNKSLSLIGINDRINFLLEMEYGYLLPELLDCSYDLLKIDKSSLSFTNDIKNKTKFYSDSIYNGIKGVCIKRDNKYILIDGHHRCQSTNLDKIQMIVAIHKV